MNMLYIGFARGSDKADKYYMIPQKLVIFDSARIAGHVLEKTLGWPVQSY